MLLIFKTAENPDPRVNVLSNGLTIRAQMRLYLIIYNSFRAALAAFNYYFNMYSSALKLFSNFLKKGIDIPVYMIIMVHVNRNKAHDPQTGGKTMYYAIQIIGSGKNKRYVIQKVIPGRGTNPTTGKAYKTENDTRKAAEELGYTIAKCGDYWEII